MMDPAEVKTQTDPQGKSSKTGPPGKDSVTAMLSDHSETNPQRNLAAGKLKISTWMVTKLFLVQI